VAVARRVVRPGAARIIGVIAAAVADADVKQVVFAKVNVAAVVISGGRMNVVNQHRLTRKVNRVVVV